MNALSKKPFFHPAVAHDRAKKKNPVLLFRERGFPFWEVVNRRIFTYCAPNSNEIKVP